MSTPGWLGQLATVSGCILPATLSALIGVAIVTVASYRLSNEWWWSGGTAPTGALPDARYHSTERQSSSKSVQRITEPQTSQPRGLPCGGWPASSKVILMPFTCTCTCVRVHTCVSWVYIMCMLVPTYYAVSAHNSLHVWLQKCLYVYPVQACSCHCTPRYCVTRDLR